MTTPPPVSGTYVHRVGTGNGTHGYYLDGSTYRLVPGTGESLFAYVYLDPDDMPQEVMLAWRDIARAAAGTIVLGCEQDQLWHGRNRYPPLHGTAAGAGLKVSTWNYSPR